MLSLACCSYLSMKSLVLKSPVWSIFCNTWVLPFLYAFHIQSTQTHHHKPKYLFWIVNVFLSDVGCILFVFYTCYGYCNTTLSTCWGFSKYSHIKIQKVVQISVFTFMNRLVFFCAPYVLCYFICNRFFLKNQRVWCRMNTCAVSFANCSKTLMLSSSLSFFFGS